MPVTLITNWTDPINLPIVDDHGEGQTVFLKFDGKATAYQYYWFRITDGFTWQVTGGPQPTDGDSTSKQILGERTITYSIFQQGGVWQYRIDKGADGNVQFVLPPLVFTAQ